MIEHIAHAIDEKAMENQARIQCPPPTEFPPGVTMSGSMLVYEPVAPCLTQPQKSRQSLDNLAGKTIGFIDNSKPNFNLLVEDLSQLLIEKHGVKAVIKQRKRSASQGLSEAAMNELVAQTDAIITGSGD
jgi:hypothetical protein